MFRWIMLLVVILIVAFFVYVSVHNKQPNDLGLTDGLFKPCPTSPNCVSSQAEKDDLEHYIAPIIYHGARKEIQLSIESYMLGKGNARVVTSSLGYVHFAVKSKIIGYIDDVEFYLPEADSVVHVRSASRVGYSDMGVNRERVRQVRDLLVD
ncbi:DUF1499 domain-containing protein [Marinomonas transparens]|uniref:DUF1499 domain-containing protein n=1 Tax=Marinomonas transparens TaxID=2795388 RepID=A0A934N0I6_9GAMM|nr:DUF1499 domain-containing protein [Marinomonas transparens]MBJ7536752.1 DUF1499 domain-containing protein [Marinomonas transparens]